MTRFACGLAAVVLAAVMFAPFLWADPPADAAAPASGSRIERDAAAFAPVLARAGLTRDTARLDLHDMDFFGGGPFRLHLWRLFMADPFKVPAVTDRFRDMFRDPAQSLYGAGIFGFARLSSAVRRNLLGDPNADSAAAAARPDGLFEALQAIHAAAGTPLAEPAAAELRTRAAAVPAELAAPIAFLLRVLIRSAQARESALSALTDAERARVFDAAPRLFSLAGQAEDANAAPDAAFVEAALGRIDLAFLAVGVGDLTLAIQAALTTLRGATAKRDCAFQAETPWGDVRITGEDAGSVDAGARILLLVDLGGNDRYAAGGCPRDVRQPASVLIDLAGDDGYEAPATVAGTFGCGRLGTGILVDVAGNDRYQAAEFTQGAALFGFGALWDLAGDDQYECLAFGQGAACAGVGALIDDAGADRYLCTSYAQGYGYTLGCGLVLDRAGNDVYTANDTDIRNPSPQSKDHNVSMVQGCGFGKRADYSDGHSLSGGLGALLDLDGNDQYSCAVFGQGCGYWYGVGLLLDGAGDDSYQGCWYVQGAPAHFAIGILNDRSGNDRYTATMNMAQGAGHDFSLGFLVDQGGDDRYQAPNLSFGAGNDNGMGVFWDQSGDDAYTVKPSITLGCSSITGKGSLREDLRCIGLFLDGGGKDQYALPHARDGAIWSMAEGGRAPIGGECGAGADREAAGK